MELGILEMLMGYGGIFAAVITWVAFVYVAATAVILLTPTKKDDDFQAKLEAIPFVGGILKALVNFSPIKPKE